MRALLLLLAFSTTLHAGDLKITFTSYPVAPETINGSPRRVLGGHVYFVDRHVFYAKGPLIREDVRGLVGDSPRDLDGSFMPQMAIIHNCETGEWINIDLDAHEYREGKRAPCPSDAWIRAAVAAARATAERRPVSSDVRYESTTVDTGETAEMFGHIAHHFITTLKETRPDDRVSRMGTGEWIIDAWYGDLQLRRPTCLDRCLTRIGMAPGPLNPSEWVDFRLLTNHTGPTPRGWKVKETTTRRGWTTSPEGKRLESVTTWETDLTEVSDAPLDPSLFKVPRGFKKVKHLYQRYSREQRTHRARR